MLYILTPLFCAALCVGAVFSFLKADRGVSAAAATASHGAYLDLSTGEKILNGFSGAQNENLYLGTYEGKPVKWRVLAVNDSTYGASSNTSLLLFADYSLGSSSFTGASAVGTSTAAQKFANPDGYYGTSKVRAYMNGGYYLTSATSLGASVAESDSLAYKLLSGLNSDLLTLTNTTTYIGRRMTPAGTSPGIRTLGNDLAKSMANASQWTDWALNSNTSAQIGGAPINTKTGTTGNNNSATNFSNLATNGIVHTTYNDKLFLLSYDDLMRADYGFADENGIYLDQGLFAKVASSVANYKENGYRAGYIFSADAMLDKYVEGWPQDPYESTNPYPKSFAEYLSGSDNVDYWIRNTIVTRAASDTAALCVWSNHVDWAFTYADSSAGVRPASVLNTSKIGYITPASLGANFALASEYATDKPEYKLFVKDNDMGENSKKAKGFYSASDTQLKLTYNNPTGKTSGKLIMLLSDKNKTDGSVVYQAATDISASATATHYESATFNLPAGTDISNYKASLLFTTNTSNDYITDGENATETIIASYTLTNGIPAPQNITGLTYSVDTKGAAESKWIDGYGDKTPDWLDLAIYNSTTYIAETTIKWTGTAKDAEEQTVTSAQVTQAGTYKVTMKLASGYVWSGDKPNEDKTFTITVAKKASTVNVTEDGTEPNPRYSTLGLPKIKTATTDTPGKAEWKADQKIVTDSDKPTDYKWTFTPTDENNYTVVEGTMPLKFVENAVKSITAVFKNEKEEAIYTTDSIDGLAKYITVTANFESGDPNKDYKNYKLTLSGGAKKLKKGDNVITVTTNTTPARTTTVTVTGVLEIAAKEITDATWKDDVSFTYPVTADEIKEGLKSITVLNNDNTTSELTDLKNLKIKGEIKAGESVELTMSLGDGEDAPSGTLVVDIAKGSVDAEKIKFDGGSEEGSSGDLKADGSGFKGTYKPDGNFDINIDPESLPDGVTVKEGFPKYKKYIGKGEPEFKADGTPKDPTKWINVDTIGGAGKFIAEIEFDYDEDNYEEIEPVSTVIDIGKADVDASGTTVAPTGADSGLKPAANGGYTATYKPGGNYEVTVDPDSVPVGATPKTPVYKKYTGEGKPEFNSDGTPKDPTKWVSVAKPDGVGDYICVVEFEPENKDNYNEIDPVVVVLTLSDKAAVEIVATLEDGATFNTANTLDELKAKLTAEIEYNNGKKESVKVADLEITCDKLRDGNKFKAGPVSVNVKFTDEGGNVVSTVVNITVQKVKVAVPAFKGGLSYTGFTVKPTVDNFNGYDGELMTFVTDKLQSGSAVGSYKAVFALNDYENYEWATTTTVSKKVFAVAVYDGEVTLLANEIAVDWNIARAVLTATKKDGALPVFASESYIGAFSDVVGLKYYTDEACTEEVAADQLAKETTYYVKAELLDTENFDLDASAAQYTVKSFSYTTPAKELTGFEKVLATVKKNWLWIVIAVAAVILLILIIALAARAAKKKRIREEQRLEKEERKEEERRQREEERRREDREERMARMSQQQQMPPMMMPQMMPQMPMQQQMPQSAPQAAAQPVAGGASSNEIAELKAEMAAMKAEQAAKEIAALRAEAAAKALTDQQIAQSKLETQFATLMARLGGEQVAAGSVGGVTLQALTELIRT
ncbi:MAG: hypothetical protein K2N17_04970, partial [Clostridia bacterium]|nr:hypothetical protein [Clostridia bacterium]